MTNFLVRNLNGEGYLSFSQFQEHYEPVSSLAVANGVVGGETGLSQAGYTSREIPLFIAFDAAANGIDFLYRTKTAQGLINSQESYFLLTRVWQLSNWVRHLLRERQATG